MFAFLKKEVKGFSLTYKKVQLQSGKENHQREMFKFFFSLLTLNTFLLWLAGFEDLRPFIPIIILVNILKLISHFLVRKSFQYYPRFIEEKIIILINYSIYFYIELIQPLSSKIDIAEIF